MDYIYLLPIPIVVYAFYKLGSRNETLGDNEFEKLDSDSLLCILNELDKKSICNTRLINKQFYNMSNNDIIWRKFCNMFGGIIKNDYCTNYQKVNKLNDFLMKNSKKHVNKAYLDSELHLFGNITIIPSEIEILRNLIKLSFNFDNIETIPPEIGRMQNLECLSVYSSKLQYIPPEIGNLKNLRELHLEFNNLQRIPIEICQLNNLKMLSLTSNSLKCLPKEIGNLHNLNQLYLNRNKLKSIPVEIENLTNLVCLCIAQNQLKTLPKEISLLTKLHTMNVSNNLRITVPDEIIRMEGLRIINIIDQPSDTTSQILTKMIPSTAFGGLVTLGVFHTLRMSMRRTQ